MSGFEACQAITEIAQTVILFLTLLAAVVIGFKQVKISNRQADISERQNTISRGLADLPFVVSPEITYDQNSKRLNICNKGQTNFYLWGTRVGDGAKVIEQEPRLITPGGFYYLLADSIEDDLRKALGKQSEVKGLFTIYLTSQNDVQYVVSTIILGKLNGAELTIHTQTTSIRPQAW
ncbi:MAG: hypothetical protein WBX11_17715 [Thiobacillaceae bacterium]